MHQVIKFVGKISLAGRANGLPDEIYGFVTIQDGDNAAISNVIAAQFGRYREMGGMVVEKNQGSLVNREITWLGHMFVSFEWIVRITVELANLTQEISLPDEKGVERLVDGTELVKN
jgi:hypothetical protein